MTLISYPTRVHFAHDILEEALHSEIDRARFRHPLLLGPDVAGSGDTSRSRDLSAAGDLWERVIAGLPRGTPALRFALPAGQTAAEAANALHILMQGQQVDVIVAFGDPEAMVLGRKCRKMLATRDGTRPALYVVPGIDGLPDPCIRNVESWTNGLPDVLICDPTVLDGASPERRLGSAIRSLVRCVESYLAGAYNPTADGMALDAFSRCVATMPHIFDAGPARALPRELMAAALNAALSQQKGVGPTQRLTAALMAHHGGLDAAAIARLILPGAVAEMQAETGKTDLLRRMLGPDADTGDAPARLRMFMAEMPGRAASLSALGVTRADLDAAVAATGPGQAISGGAARRVLDAVY